MRLLAIALAVLIASCARQTPPPEPVKPDPTNEAWYPQTVEQLTAINKEARSLLKRAPDRAGELITKGQPLMGRLLSVPRPTLAATEAASDLDDLYGRMLLFNRHYGWARLQFQKNVARWRNWRPQTPETDRRRQEAEQRIVECDRLIAK